MNQMHVPGNQRSFSCAILQHDVELVDPRGRTPLHLAISMGHLECAKALLKNGADANKENAKYWTGQSNIYMYMNVREFFCAD